MEKLIIILIYTGSRFVYSTCSLNPMEDESVVCAILKRYHKTLRLVPIRQVLMNTLTASTPRMGSAQEQWEKLRGLKWRDGLNSWRTDVGVMTDEGAVSEEEEDEEDNEEEDEVINDLDPPPPLLLLNIYEK